MIEAATAAFLVLSALACISVTSRGPSPDKIDDLRLMSSDLLHVLEYSGGGPGHPGLAQALSSQSAWSEHNTGLERDISSHLPAGFYSCLITPYGVAGNEPPDCTAMYVRPFIAYSQERGEIIDCSLIVWRPS